MEHLKKAALMLLFCALGACTPLQTKRLKHNPPEPARVLLDVPFVPQDPYYCGPATVSMLLQHQGLTADQHSIARAIYLPGRKGTLQSELKAYIRQEGLIAYTIPNTLPALLREVELGNPVLVLQNLGFNWWPRWHYAVVVGYDIPAGQLILHTGDRPQYRLSLGTFERTWQRSNNWGITALNPQHKNLRVSGDADSLLEALFELDSTQQRPIPSSAYYAAAKHWPTNSLAWFSLANAIYQEDSSATGKQSALKGFLRAAQLEPDPGYYNNLAYTAAELGCEALYHRSLACGLTLSPNNRHLMDTKKHPPSPIASDSSFVCPVLHCKGATFSKSP